MSIHEQRIVLRILEACQAELKGVKLKDYAGTKRKFEHGLWDVDAQMHVSDVIFSGRDYNEIIAALDSLAGRFFTYEDDEEWWKCGFISNPKYKKHTGIITFRVSNDLWDVFTKFAKGYREFELNKALALPTGYSLRFYMLMSGQVYPLDISLDNLKERLGIPADKYKDKNGKDRIDNFEERVLKPAKAALDESCPYTFNYVKVRENPNNKRSKVTGFRFYPVYQPQFRDEELEVKELQAKVTARHQIDSHVYEYLRYSCGFTSEEINRNKETFITAQENITDLIRELAILNGKSREKNNPKGWIAVHQVCMSHAKNKFVKASNQGGEPTAERFSEILKEFFMRDREYDDAGLTPKERFRERQSLETKELLIELRSLLDSELSKDSEFRSQYYREALNYLNRFWKEIFAYLDDGELPIDNNLAERTIRKLTTQRNNSLHYGSDAGAGMAATYHSVIGTVKLHGSSVWNFIGTFFQKYL